jgi:hypothetical protein
MPPSPLATSLQAYLQQLNQSNDGQPAALSGFMSRGGAIRPIPGDEVPYAGAVAAASEDGHSGIKPAIADGDNVKILADRYGRLWVRLSGGASKDATTSATGETERELAGAHTLLEYAGLNLNGGPAYLMVFDSATIPVNGTVPALTALPVASGEFGSIEVEGLDFSEGISVCFSSTALTLTKYLGDSSFTIIYS